MKQINWYDWTLKTILALCCLAFTAWLLFGCNNSGNSKPMYKDSIVKFYTKLVTVNKDGSSDTSDTKVGYDTIKVRVK